MNSPIRIVPVLVWPAAAAFFIYVVLKALHLGITWDEAFTFLTFVDTGRLYPGAGGGMAANNHLLNTWLAFLSTRLFGDGEAALRLPNIVAYAVYLSYTGRFAVSLRNPFVAVSAFVAFQASAYLLDFFCLARGYGLSFALLAGSMFHLQRFCADRRPADFHRSLGLGCMAVLANIAMLHYALLLFAVPVMVRWSEGRPAPGAPAGFRLPADLYPRWIRVSAAVYFAGMALYGLALQRYGALFYGGTSGFFPDTVRSLVKRMAYERSPGPVLETALVVCAIVATLAGWLYLFRSRRRPDEKAPAFLAAALWLLTGCCFAGILQHHLFGSLYLIERAALYLYILFVFAGVAFLDVLSVRRKRIWLIPVAYALMMLIHFFRTADRSFVLEWKRDADVRAIWSDVKRWRSEHVPGDRMMRMGVSLEYEQPLNYYLHTRHIDWIYPLDRKDRDRSGMDLYLLDPHDRIGRDPLRLQTLAEYPAGAALLMPAGGSRD